jgi:transcriptional regulator with XRE-family HTH domain
MLTAALIESARLTDRDLAARIGVSQQSVNRWRRGEQVPGLERVDDLAIAIGVPAADLEVAIVTDLRSRVRRSDPSPDSDRLLNAAADVVLRRGLSALTLRAVAEHINVPITEVAYRWRTRDALAEATLNHALLHATQETLGAVVSAHLDTMTRVGPGALWPMPGVQHAVTLVGSENDLAQLVGHAVLHRQAHKVAQRA